MIQFMRAMLFLILAALSVSSARAEQGWLSAARKLDPRGEVRLNLAVLGPAERPAYSPQAVVGARAYFVPSRGLPGEKLTQLLPLSEAAWAKLLAARARQGWPQLRLVFAELPNGTMAVTSRDPVFRHFLGLAFDEMPLVLGAGMNEWRVDHELQHVADFRAGLEEALLEELSAIGGPAARRQLTEFVFELRGYRAELRSAPKGAEFVRDLIYNFWLTHGFATAVTLRNLNDRERAVADATLRRHSLAEEDSSFYRAILEQVHLSALKKRLSLKERCQSLLL